MTTVEVDARVAEAARQALAAAGLRPRVVTGDGAKGVPDRAPYDRIVATCGLRRIPGEWVEQVRPGGVILAPWGTDFGPRDALVRLTVHGDATASGSFIQLAEFMKLRSQRTAHPSYPPGLPMADTTSDAWPPHGDWHPFPFLAGLRMRRAAYAVQSHDDGHTQWLYSLSDDSWTAAVRRERTGRPDRTVVRRVGQRRLWEEFLAAHDWWHRQGEPGIDRFGLSVGPQGEVPWLDEPGQAVGC